MSLPVTMGAQLLCNQGVAPSAFMVVDPMRPTIEKKPAGVITDNIPMTNIMPFGMCRSLANPAVAAATSAALGVLTPQPCIPVTTAPWTPGSTMVTIGGKPALTDSSMVMCNWAGKIDVLQPGPVTTTIT
ncbi:MAG: DUF4280 domain-containing protein [Acidimicrobiales bacterium]